MVSLAFIRRFLFNVKFWDIFVAFLLATLPFIFRCSRRPHFVRWAIAWLVPIRLLCLFFAHTYGGNIAVEAFYSAILLLLMIGGLLCFFEEKLSNVLFYFSSGFATWYISDRLFLVIASICRLNSSLVPYFTERTPSHILLYITCFWWYICLSISPWAKRCTLWGTARSPCRTRCCSCCWTVC